MNHLYSFSAHANSLFKEKILYSLTSLQKRIIYIVSLAFGCLAVCYAINRYCFWQKETDLSVEQSPSKGRIKEGERDDFEIELENDTSIRDDKNVQKKVVFIEDHLKNKKKITYNDKTTVLDMKCFIFKRWITQPPPIKPHNLRLHWVNDPINGRGKSLQDPLLVKDYNIPNEAILRIDTNLAGGLVTSLSSPKKVY